MIDGARRCVVPFGLVVLLTLPASAGRLPDWCQSIADAMPVVPAELPTHPSRVLLSETTVSVKPNGDLIVGRRVANQALSASTSGINVGFFHFDEHTDITRSKAWHLPPSGKARKSKGTAFDVTHDDAFLTDSKTRMIYVDGTEKGSLVCFDFEALEVPAQLAYQWMVYEDAPTDVARFRIDVPEGWSVRHAWPRGAGPDPVVNGGTSTWEMRDIEPNEYEPLSESAIDTAPLLVVGFAPPDGESVGPVTMPSWITLANWYEDLAQERDKVTPEISAVSASLLGEMEAGFFADLDLLGTYVRDNVRYVAKEIGIGGYRPHYAQDVLSKLWGDCKDKGTLYRSLLSAAGHVSYPVLINTSIEGTVSNDVPSVTAFNHFVVSVPIPEGTPVPESFASAVVDGGALGPLVIVDTTDEFTSIGSIPSGLRGKTGLVVAGERSALLPLPPGDPSIHRIERRFVAEIRDDGSLAIELETTRYGEPAASYRRAYSSSVREFREAVEEDLREEWPEGIVESYVVVPETEDGAFVESVGVTVPALSRAGAPDLIALFPSALSGLPRVSLTRRETPVRYAYVRTLRYESTITGVPPGTATPKNRSSQGEGWSVEASFTRDGSSVQGTWTTILERTRFAPESFEELKDFWSAARRAANNAVAR